MALADYLIISQIIFNITFAVVFIAFGIIVVALLYYLFKLVKHMENISSNIEKTSDEVRKNIVLIIEQITKLPFISRLFKKSSRKGRQY